MVGVLLPYRLHCGMLTLPFTAFPLYPLDGLILLHQRDALFMYRIYRTRARM